MSIVRNTPKARQVGVSLIELMVGIAVGLLVIAGVVATYAIIARSGAEIFGSAKLNEELRGAMDLITSDIRRAGSSQKEAITNPFMVVDVTDIKIHDSGACILFAYDATFKDTPSGDVDKTDYFGYKLSGGAIYARKTNNDGSGVINCAGSGSDWERLTDDENVVIDPGSLTFSTTRSVCINSTKADSSNTDWYWEVTAVDSRVAACDPTTPGYLAASGDRLLEKRQILVKLGGKLKRKPEFNIALQQSVLLPNDRIFNVP